jgi:peptide/nickel transport system substrate-binding protein
MKPTRRQLMQASAGAAALAAAPAIVKAQTKTAANKTLRGVILQDVRVFDPVISTASSTSYHAAMVYDQLFGVDANLNPQPQMVSKWGLSDDRKTYTFELRDGLKFTDGTPVTTADCVASLRRWGAHDTTGRTLFSRVKDTPIKDEKTFQLVLSEPWGLTLDCISKVSTSCCYMMRKKEADTDPNQPFTEIVGSGPFKMNKDLSRSGASYVYDRNENYVPRTDKTSGTAGAKIAKLDRVIWDIIPDAQTAMGALQNGEIDFYEMPPIDLIGQLESDPNIHVDVLNQTGLSGVIRMNHLYAPFDNVKARQALLYLINQDDILKAAVGNAKYYQQCSALFGCGTPMENDANTGWFKGGQNLAKAKQLFQESGYDGRPIVIMQPTDLFVSSVAAQLLAQWLRQIGVNVELAASDWGAISVRRGVSTPPDKGGWHLFAAWTSGYQMSSPLLYWGHAAGGMKGAYFGWPTNEPHEKLREAWAAAPTLDERKAIARKIQEESWDWVPFIPFGKWLTPSAWRKNVKGFIGVPEVIPFWNVEKT